MQQNPEIYFVIIIGIILGLLLVGFIVTILFLYQRRQKRQEEEMVRMKDQYEKEALLSQLEIQENTFKAIAQELHDNIGQMLSVVKITLSALPLEKEHQAYDLVINSQQVLHKAIPGIVENRHDVAKAAGRHLHPGQRVRAGPQAQRAPGYWPCPTAWGARAR